MSKTTNGRTNGDPEHRAISELAQALGQGSTKLNEALVLTLGKEDSRSVRANLLDQQLQPLVADLSVPLE